MAKINKKLTSGQFLAALAESGARVGGIPFVFDANSERGKRFLEDLAEVGLEAGPDEVFEAIPTFFKGDNRWGISVISFSKLGKGQYEVGLNPDNVAIELARQMSHGGRFFNEY